MASVEWSPVARRSLRTHYDYIAPESVLNADRWLLRIEAAVDALVAFPEIGSPIEVEGFADFREQIVGSHRVVYRYNGTVCRIGNIVRAEQNFARAVRPEDFE